MLLVLIQIAERLKSHAAASGRQQAQAAVPKRPAGHQGQPGSLSALRKRLAAAQALQAACAAAAPAGPEAVSGADAADQFLAAADGSPEGESFSSIVRDCLAAVAGLVVTPYSSGNRPGELLCLDAFMFMKTRCMLAAMPCRPVREFMMLRDIRYMPAHVCN